MAEAHTKWVDAPEFHVVGDALMDVLATGLPQIPGWDEDVNADEIRCHVGGSALNTAAHLKALLGSAHNGTVAFYGCVGEDAFARVVRARLEELGVVPHLTPLHGYPTGSCIVLSGGSGRTFVTCAGAAGRIAAEHIADIVASVRKATGPVHVHFGGFYSYGPLRWELPAFVRELRAAAKEQDVALTVSVDTNGNEQAHLEGMKEALDVFDVFKGNKAEAEAISGCSDVHEALKFLAQHCSTAVVTCGSEGAVYMANGENGHVEACHVEPIDTTGAGDACSAGLVACLARGAPVQAAVRVGCVSGTVNCTNVGGCDTAVTADSVQDFLRERQLPVPHCLSVLTAEHQENLND